MCFLQANTATTAALFWNDEHKDAPITAKFVNRVIQKIRLAERHERLDGCPRSFGKPGRPRKNRLVNNEHKIGQTILSPVPTGETTLRASSDGCPLLFVSPDLVQMIFPVF
jgi:hypothetical protein